MIDRPPRSPSRPPRRRDRFRPAPLKICELEDRVVLSPAAFDLIGLSALRADPQFSGMDGAITVNGQQKPVSVVVIDTGLDRTHPALSANFELGYDFFHSRTDPIDNAGHGTHVAGIIGASDPSIGVAPAVGLIGLRVFDDQAEPRAAYNTQIAALNWVIDSVVSKGNPYNIVAVNMSLGGGHYTQADLNGTLSGNQIRNQLASLQQAGVTSVVAAGNDYYGNQTLNSSAPGIFATLNVGAVYEKNEGGLSWGSGAIDYATAADRITSFSQRPDTSNVIFGPGALIRSTYPGGRYQEMAGTSQATPMVAGVVALMQDAAWTFGGEFLRPEKIREILQTTADSVVDAGANVNVRQTGVTFPRVNAYRAVQAVKQYEQQRLGNGGGGGGGGTGSDPNGFMGQAAQVPLLDGSLLVDPTSGANLPYEQAYAGTIGIDGGTIAVGNKDVDMFRIQTAFDGAVTIRTAARTSAAVDTVIRLFDARGNAIDANDNDPAGGTLYSRLVRNLPAGTYYVGVSARGTRPTTRRAPAAARPARPAITRSNSASATPTPTAWPPAPPTSLPCPSPARGRSATTTASTSARPTSTSSRSRCPTTGS
ncbi:MAG: DVUA0089 family protein [Isosphaeraceae bacterium]